MLEFKALLFDLDGTLLDTAPDFISALNKQLELHGRAPLPDHAIRTSVTNGSIGLIQDGFGLAPDHPQFEILREEFLELYFANLADKTALFAGLQLVLDDCAARNIPWGVVTNKPWRYTESTMVQLGLMDAAATVICPDHVKHAKPDPESILLACSEIATAPQDCLYVGDHVRDIDAGRAAGTRNIAAAWGYIETSENIHNWQADWIVDQSEQLHGLLFKD
ncbi:MAG: HAD-IA family hydrolase [Porticoccaceae bacterium]|jgi:phosphoglycolate phosphatase|nr:HAD-IA family hydrolase [Porticoccaceae bacterium]